MAILHENKEDLDSQYGLPKEAQRLVGGDKSFEAEEAWCYAVGRYLVTVGFRNQISHYACFAKDKRDGDKFDDLDVEVCLALISPDAEWTICAGAMPGENDSEDAQKTPESVGIVAEYEADITDSKGNSIPISASRRKFRPYVIGCTRIEPPPQGGIEELAAKMNSAVTTEEKLDAAIAVINELIAERGKG
jgi:hypothetical protein